MPHMLSDLRVSHKLHLSKAPQHVRRYGEECRHRPRQPRAAAASSGSALRPHQGFHITASSLKPPGLTLVTFSSCSLLCHHVQAVPGPGSHPEEGGVASWGPSSLVSLTETSTLAEHGLVVHPLGAVHLALQRLPRVPLPWQPGHEHELHLHVQAMRTSA